MPSYEMDLEKFEGVNTQVLGISVDHVPCLKAWAESLGGIRYPLLSDFWPHGMVALRYGVLRADGKSERALFVVDKAGIVRYIDIHDIDKQPDNDEVLRVLEALEAGVLPPVEAKKEAPDAEAPAPAPVVEKPTPAPVAERPAGPVSIPIRVMEASRVAPVPKAAAPRRVVMYCRPGCIDCRLASRFLQQNGIEFTEVNVLANPAAEARVRAWTGGPLISPVFDIDGEIVIDFRRNELIRALGL